MMKKQYITPETEIILIDTAQMLCLSTPFGDDANDPANSPDMDWDDWDEE